MFHISRLSLWPLIISLCVLVRFVRFYLSIKVSFNLYILLITLIFFNWFKDVSRERDLLIEHRSFVVSFFKTGIILFISSEVIFFLSFFWCYFDFTLVADMELGGVWPPKGIQSVRPFRIPLLNTIILLSSGVTITWTHFCILQNNWFVSVVSLAFTLLLGIYFLLIQLEEYSDASFNFIRRGYGRIFFLATGFHGFHVLLGCFLISGRLIRITIGLIDRLSHINFEFAAWYWHFVDVVWLFLFIFIYWWGF